ncbi:hypothetical protein RRG08_002686 [Elysia crispata]|uniref:Uncharacterized protein n=1 Tax=Elysia crispata TaxID=231223 RepID=A0AAE0XUT2_9GAST|nr:hypothetical protein RRG08_002686 [Elysia crispata]
MHCLPGRSPRRRVTEPGLRSGHQGCVSVEKGGRRPLSTPDDALMMTYIAPYFLTKLLSPFFMESVPQAHQNVPRKSNVGSLSFRVFCQPPRLSPIVCHSGMHSRLLLPFPLDWGL